MKKWTYATKKGGDLEKDQKWVSGSEHQNGADCEHLQKWRESCHTGTWHKGGPRWLVPVCVLRAASAFSPVTAIVHKPRANANSAHAHIIPWEGMLEQTLSEQVLSPACSDCRGSPRAHRTLPGPLHFLTSPSPFWRSLHVMYSTMAALRKTSTEAKSTFQNGSHCMVTQTVAKPLTQDTLWKQPFPCPSPPSAMSLCAPPHPLSSWSQ